MREDERGERREEESLSKDTGMLDLLVSTTLQCLLVSCVRIRFANHCLVICPLLYVVGMVATNQFSIETNFPN